MIIEYYFFFAQQIFIKYYTQGYFLHTYFLNASLNTKKIYKKIKHLKHTKKYKIMLDKTHIL